MAYINIFNTYLNYGNMSSQESGAESELENDITVESIKTIASSYGITKLNDEALQFLLDDVNFRLKEISQVVFYAFWWHV